MKIIIKRTVYVKVKSLVIKNNYATVITAALNVNCVIHSERESAKSWLDLLSDRYMFFVFFFSEY